MQTACPLRPQRAERGRPATLTDRRHKEQQSAPLFLPPLPLNPAKRCRGATRAPPEPHATLTKM